MKTFEVSWTETLNRCKEIKAGSLEEAFDIAKDQYFDGEVDMDKNSFVRVEIMAVDPKTGKSKKDEFE